MIARATTRRKGGAWQGSGAELPLLLCCRARRRPVFLLLLRLDGDDVELLEAAYCTGGAQGRSATLSTRAAALCDTREARAAAEGKGEVEGEGEREMRPNSNPVCVCVCGCNRFF